MSLVFTANTTPATGAVAIFSLKALLKSVGWTVPRSSDGLTYNSSGDQITSSGSGAGGMNNASAWFVIVPPGGTAQYCFQLGATTSWRIFTTRFSTLTAGTPSATQTPAPVSVTDRIYLAGGGTDASPTFAGSTFAADGTYRFHAAADNASPYGFYSVAYAIGGGLPSHALFVDPLTDTDAGDTDPFVFYSSNGPPGSSLLGDLDGNPSGSFFNMIGAGAQALMNNPFGILGPAYVSPIAIHGIPGGTQTTLHGQLGPNPVNGKDDLLPCYYATDPTDSRPGIKGRSTLIRFPMSGRTTGDTQSVSGAGAKDWIVLGGSVFPWNGSVPLV